MLSNGIKIQELKVGDGAIVEPGKKIKIYYTSRIKSTGEDFDMVQNDPGMSFIFQQQHEVIEGWDIGISGMRVGGERRIICPRKMCYGVRGLELTAILENHLEFDVKLLHVENEQNKSQNYQKTSKYQE